MINCFIDPIFLAINDSISSKHFSEVLYPYIYEFCQRIEEIEKETNQREILFNISFEFIANCMKFNPYQLSSNIICRDWFRRFLSYFLKQHRNFNCDIVLIDEDIDLQYKYENANVPSVLINDWCKFINQCSNCKNCEDINLDLLSHETLGSELTLDSPIFFDRLVYDLISWLNEHLSSIQIETHPPEVNLAPELKKMGDWSHSHPKMVMKEVDKLLNFRLIREVRPIGTTGGINKNRIKVNSFNQYNIFISDKKGAHIFIVNTSARNEFEGEIVLNELSTLLSNYEIRS